MKVCSNALHVHSMKYRHPMVARHAMPTKLFSTMNVLLVPSMSSFSQKLMANESAKSALKMKSLKGIRANHVRKVK